MVAACHQNMRNFVPNPLSSILPALIFLFLVTSVSAKVTVSESTKYFFVDGKTGKQIYSQVTKRAPAKLRKNHWIAATYARYNFKQVKLGVRNNRCVATKVNVHLSLVYYFPKWKSKKRGSKILQKRWEDFSRELVRHEKTHGRIFTDTAKKIENELRRLSGKATKGCRRIATVAKRRIAAITKRGDAKHAAFDRKDRRPNSRMSKLERAFVKSK